MSVESCSIDKPFSPKESLDLLEGKKVSGLDINNTPNLKIIAAESLVIPSRAALKEIGGRVNDASHPAMSEAWPLLNPGRTLLSTHGRTPELSADGTSLPKAFYVSEIPAAGIIGTYVNPGESRSDLFNSVSIAQFIKEIGSWTDEMSYQDCPIMTEIGVDGILGEVAVSLFRATEQSLHLLFDRVAINSLDNPNVKYPACHVSQLAILRTDRSMSALLTELDGMVDH
jgi:hypothetical protein